ncbi:MAG TPA: LLM class flavin-dependent oxidoreductase [Rhodopila sp.]|uniref:LLM class flavin-dependent oxidoreductase n=1 Tax=Rhodopila sp. TaxID=2480087 RepID=UPI002B5BE87B|nr:LLM class flavin-dependent oxidoreductase [Rhodopila sp.]HVY18230.1 LLM class flavin-dependent oxidoreductase [Rhodopila sp.]
MAIDPSRGKMHLGAFIHPTGNHIAAWLHPEAQIDAGQNFRHYCQLAQMAEAAKFDMMFLADAVAVRDGKQEALSRWPQYMAYFEPVTLLSGVAAVTEHIGVVSTATTSYNEPYNVARKFASLDLISGGRAGWNVVTSANLSEAFNFGREAHYEHGERYDRAEEFFDVVKGLWDSWEDDAFIRDRSTGRYYDPAKLHALNHKGEHFSVRGPLNVARSPQGHPVIFQAGASEPGKELAARTAEGVFVAGYTLEGAQAFYADLKGRMPKYGRDPDHLKVMPGLNAIAGRTEKEAREKHAYLQSLIHHAVGLEVLSNALAGFDLEGLDPDGPLPPDVYDIVPKGSTSAFRNVTRWAKEENLTIRQLYMRFAGARGQRTLVGSGSQIADNMAEWFLNRGVDGFLIQPSHVPGGLKDFIDHVVPELQERGLFRTDYEGTTLRDNLGLPKPVNRWAARESVA